MAEGVTMMVLVVKTVAGVVVVVSVVRACGGEKVETVIKVTTGGVDVLVKVFVDVNTGILCMSCRSLWQRLSFSLF